jgi:type IV pilus assembly protein PilY1
VYVGANDGMLHAFDGNTGVELLAYIPSKVYDNLTQLTNPNYTHRYFVSGSPNAVDAFYNNSWHTVLASGLGAGGQSVFALDVTEPANFAQSNASSLVLWEFSDLDDNDMGLSYSRPSIVRMANGEWAAVFGNGYNNTLNDGHSSTTGNAVLYIVNIETGALIKKLDTGEGMAEDPLSLARPNGLATPSVIDINGDSIADYIYVGDLFGNLWKIDVTSSNTNQWDFAFKQGSTPKPLFVAKDASNNRQPITGTVTVSRIPNAYNTFQVYFGTGKYLETGDNLDVSTQTFYAIRDDGATEVTRTDLLEQTILSEVGNFRITSENILIPASHKGWYLDLSVNGIQDGERVISDPIYRQGKIIFTTIIPNSDPCEYGGTSWLMELDALEGARLNYTPFDTNDDGLFNASDLISYTDGGGNTSTEVASGMKSTVGLVSTPVILNAGDKEYKYMPGSSGNVQTVSENPGVNVTGRQSWRQIR